ncbi:efflux RND transporter periplasmic adaptor subunit [Brevibacillus sp. TJ4]|uniref:efflux RND transporter periplasmic adaptor subunit n=1 Tax=Brevibacillus sp. TJ4 TaxID=3234853 RepID=UPI0037D67C7D
MSETSSKKRFGFAKAGSLKKRVIIAGVAVAVLGGGGVFAYQTLLTPTQAETTYQVVRVGRGDVTETVLASGTVQASKRTSLSFSDAESAKDVVSSINVQVGDEVKEGQVLATMDDSVAQMNVTKAKANLMSAQAKLEEAEKSLTSAQLVTLHANLNKAKTEYDNAKQKMDLEQARNTEAQAKTTLQQAEKTYNAQKEMYGLGAISQTEYEQAQIDLEKARRDYQTAALALQQAEAQADVLIQQAEAVYQTAQEELQEAQKGPDSATVLSARAEVEQARAELQEAQAALQAVTLRAPMDGVIVQVNGNVGEVPGDDFIIMDNSNSGELEVLAQISESDIGKVKKGLPVTFTTSTYSDKAFTGEVKLVYPEATTNSGVTSYDVLLSVNNAEGMLKIGMTTNVTIEVGTSTNALVIPAIALQSVNGSDGVFLLNRGSSADAATDSAGGPAQTGQRQSGQMQEGQHQGQEGEQAQRQEGVRRIAGEAGRSSLPYRFQPVKIGLFSSDRVEILEGLAEGDQVVILNTVTQSSGGMNQMRGAGAVGGMGAFPAGGGGGMRVITR